MTRKITKKQGFTLIELVGVVVILGILAVTAAARFLNLQSDARKATIEGSKGALESAFQLFSAKAQVPSAAIRVDDSGNKTMTLNGFEYGLTDDFYPKLPFEAFSSLEPLLSIVNLDVVMFDGEHAKGLIYNPYPPGFELFYGDYDTTHCFISYSPNKKHNMSDLGYVEGMYFYMVNDGC